MIHLVYPVRNGDRNPEFRTSLRSVQENLLDDVEITIVGYCPSWIRGARSVPGNAWSTPQQNVYENVRAACAHDAVPDDIVIMNDDFMIMQPVESFETNHRCTLDEHVELLKSPNSWWYRSLVNTRIWLKERGIDDALSYELHRPFPASRVQMAKVLDEAADLAPRNPPQWRTIYGNFWNVESTQAEDAKIYPSRPALPLNQPFVSTTDQSYLLGPGRLLESRFSTPSRWEKP